MSDVEIKSEEDGIAYQVAALSEKGRAWLRHANLGPIIPAADADKAWQRISEAGLSVLIDGLPCAVDPDFNVEAAVLAAALHHAMLRSRGRRRSGKEKGAAELPSMTDTELAALDTLLAHIADDEMKDFENNPREGHIYQSIHAIAKWRGLNISDWPEP
jgi:hypothetical protein